MIYDLIETKKAKIIRNNPNKHIPNKIESKLLRKLMSENSLSEEEIRSNIKFRRMLAEASKLNKTKMNDKVNKWYYNIIKIACRKSKLVPQHPNTIKIIQTILDDYSSWNIPWFIYNINTKAENVVKLYAKK